MEPVGALTSTETIRLTRDGEKGGGGYGGGERWRLYTYRYTVTTDQNDCCIKMGSNESHSNVSFSNCKGQSYKTVSTDHDFWRERRAEAESNRGPSAYHPNAFRLAKQANPTLLALLKQSGFDSQ